MAFGSHEPPNGTLGAQVSGPTAAWVAPTAWAVVSGLAASVLEMVTVSKSWTTSGTAVRNVSLAGSAEMVGEPTDSARRWPLQEVGSVSNCSL